MPFCSFCGHEISGQAVTCPNCGHPNEARTMIPEVAFQRTENSFAERAGFWMRFLALLIDVVIIVIVTSPNRRTVYLGDRRVTVLYTETSALVQFFYTWLMVGLLKGRTLGSMALGLRVSRPNGDPVGLGRAAARAGMAVVSWYLIFLGYLWAAWDPEKRTWHDMVADTRVLRVRR